MSTDGDADEQLGQPSELYPLYCIDSGVPSESRYRGPFQSYADAVQARADEELTGRIRRCRPVRGDEIDGIDRAVESLVEDLEDRAGDGGVGMAWAAWDDEVVTDVGGLEPAVRTALSRHLTMRAYMCEGDEEKPPSSAGRRFPRTHEKLARDITADPIFLFQRRRVDYCICTDHEWDSDACKLRDLDGNEVSDEQAIENGVAIEHWDTMSVFLTREDGEDFGRRTAYNYPKGWRVYCVHALGDLVHVLADATEGGRYR